MITPFLRYSVIAALLPGGASHFTRLHFGAKRRHLLLRCMLALSSLYFTFGDALGESGWRLLSPDSTRTLGVIASRDTIILARIPLYDSVKVRWSSFFMISTNSGMTWSERDFNGHRDSLSGAVAPSALSVWYVTYPTSYSGLANGILYSSHDAGSTWDSVGPLTYPVTVSWNTPTTLFTTSLHGSSIFPREGISRSYDGGRTWTWITSGWGFALDYGLRVTSFVQDRFDSLILFASADNGYDQLAYWSTNGGDTWSSRDVRPDGWDGRIFAMHGTIYRESYRQYAGCAAFRASGDYGRTWRSLGCGIDTLAYPSPLFSVATDDAAMFVALLGVRSSGNYEVFLSLDTGRVWSRVPFLTFPPLFWSSLFVTRSPARAYLSSEKGLWVADLDSVMTQVEVAPRAAAASCFIYPNPAPNEATVLIEDGGAGLLNIRLFDVIGQAVPCPISALAANSGRRIFSLDFSSLPPGLYQLHITFDRMTKVIPITHL